MSRHILATMVAVACIGGSASPSGAQDASNADLLALIQTGARAFEAEYIGSYSRRSVKATVSNGDDEVEETKDFVIDVWEYHGEHPTREVIECRVDGAKAEGEACLDEQRLEPPHRIFAADADEHYRLEYVGVTPWKGQQTHRVRVIPLQETSRHLKGDVYFLQDSLRPHGMDVTLAEYPFGLESLSIVIDFEEKDGRPVLAGGKTDVHISVPFLIDQRTVAEFTARDQQLLKER